jgi:hypothetical protein
MKTVINRTRASSLTEFRAARTNSSELPAARLYRIRKSFAVVHLEQTAKGRIVFLPEGGELRVVGLSPCLREGFEVLYERRLYSIFKEDLLGPWSNPIESTQMEESKSGAIRAIPAMGACA